MVLNYILFGCPCCLINSKGSRYLTKHLWVTFIMRQLIFIVPNFSWPNSFRHLEWFVECFYFVWCEEVWSCQECSGEGGAVAVSSRWVVISMAKVTVRTGAVQANVMSSSECRAIWVVRKWWICSAWTVFPCLRQFNRCPSWLVYQWK